MLKCFIQLGKFGDIFSILPILYADFKESGIKPNLVISRQYLSALDSVSYVNPHIYEGNWGDLGGAIKWAKERFDEVISLQTHGKDFPFQHKTPSFQCDQYLRAGRLKDWDKLPLILDTRNTLQERILFTGYAPLVRKRTADGGGRQKFILFGDKSESAAFPHTEEIFTLLEKEFPEHKIGRLSEIKAKNISDLVGLYDKALAVVTIDTVHVHLSKASKVPTFVLAADGWRGSACSSRFKFYMRYGEWGRRKHKLISELKDEINKTEKPKIIPFKTDFKNGYNPSFIEHGGKIIGTYRHHPVNTWKTKLVFFDGEKHHPLNVPESIAHHSIEDARMFIFNDKVMASYTISTGEDGVFRCCMAYGEITEKDGIYSMSHIQPRHLQNDFSTMVKNWCPFVWSGRLFFIYGIEKETQIIIEVDGERVIGEHRSPAPKWGNGQIRGGCVLPHGDTLLRFFHSRADYTDKTFRYFIGCVLLENKPPFKTLQISQTSILSGNEIFTSDCFHWKRNVVFGLGAHRKDDKIILSVGINDCHSALVELKEEHLKL